MSNILLLRLSHTDHINERRVCNAVCPGKDVDGFHVVNVGRMCLDQSTVLPATPWGVWEIIRRTGKKDTIYYTFKIKCNSIPQVYP